MTSAGHTEGFFARVRKRWDAGLLLCVGLDPEVGRLPESVRPPEGASAEEISAAILAFNQHIIDATAEYACAFKPNSAFYEAYGPAGVEMLRATITYIHMQHPDVPVLLDAKRGDIGSTSAAYARAAFEVLGGDAITLQPYLGSEALSPFLERAEKGCFILCRTSNPGAGELQDLRVASPGGSGAEPLYLHLARRVANEWNARGNCGLVVGATYPQELGAVRAVVGDLPFLVPGIGAQGGDLAAVLREGRDSHGQGLLISASRSILYASAGTDFAQAAGAEAARLRDEIARLTR